MARQEKGIGAIYGVWERPCSLEGPAKRFQRKGSDGGGGAPKRMKKSKCKKENRRAGAEGGFENKMETCNNGGQIK